MGLKKIFAVINNPKIAAEYFRKYGKKYAALCKFTYHKCLGKREYDILEKKLHNATPTYTPENAPHVFTRRPMHEIGDMVRNSPLYKTVLAQAEKTLRGNLLILNRNRPNMFDKSTGHYLWYDDFFEGYTYKMSHYSQARAVNNHPGADIKIPWETSRMQYLLSLGLAYCATQHEKYAEAVSSIVLDFMERNDYDNGPNWNVSMEVGIRVANVILACEMIQGSYAFNDEFYKKFCVFVYAHKKHIINNLENTGGKTSNHFLGDLLGLAATAAACPFLPGMNKVKRFVCDSLHYEILHQIQEDGSDYEGSTSYQRLVGELLCFSILAAENFDFMMTNPEKDRLFAMARFEDSIRMKNGRAPQVGDNDSGRVFQLVEEDTRNHASCIRLLLVMSKGMLLDNNRNDLPYILWSNIDISSVWTPSKQTIQKYNDFNAIRYFGENVYFLLVASTPENNGMPGHAHNDVLSFNLAAGEDEFISDPGSGEYTGHPDIRNLLRFTGSHSTIKVGELEQRRPISGALFQWEGKIHADIGYAEECDSYILNGVYANARSEYVHRRSVLIRKNESTIEIEDEIVGAHAPLSMCLPVYPGIAVEKEDDCVRLIGHKYELKLSGTWSFALESGLYSTQYHETVRQTFVRCESTMKKNTLRIEIKVVDSKGRIGE